MKIKRIRIGIRVWWKKNREKRKKKKKKETILKSEIVI